MEQSFHLEDSLEGDVPVLAVSGEIDLATAPLLRERLDAHLDAGTSTIVVDLREATFLDSTALGVLVNGLKRCREAGGDLPVVLVEERIMKLFAITGLHETFAIWPSVEAALAELRSDGAAIGRAEP